MFNESRVAKFKKFNENINFAKETLYSDIETPEGFGEEYDYIALGGDQVWNHTFTKSFSDIIGIPKLIAFLFLPD